MRWNENFREERLHGKREFICAKSLWEGLLYDNVYVHQRDNTVSKARLGSALTGIRGKTQERVVGGKEHKRGDLRFITGGHSPATFHVARLFRSFL